MNRIKQLIAGAALAFAAATAFGQSNQIGTLLTSAARTVTTSSSDVTNTSTRMVHVIVNITSYTSGTWTPTVEGKDPVSGNYYTICTGPILSATGLTVIRLGPGNFAQFENEAVCNNFIPRTWRVTMTGASTPSATFSVGFNADF